MGWAWIGFGLLLLGLGGDSLRHIVVRRPTSREVAEAVFGPGAKDLPPALEDMARTRWMIQGSSLAQLLAVLFAVAAMRGCFGSIATIQIAFQK